MRRAGWAVAALRAAVTLALAGITAAVALVFVGKIPLGTGERAEEGTPFYVLAYHYGYAFYDRNFKEVEKIEVKVGETVTLHVVPALALPKEVFLDLGERSVRQGVGGLPPGDPEIRKKIQEDVALGNAEHIIGISAYPVYLTTNVTPILNGRPFREGGPRTLEEAVRRKDAAIKTVTFTAKRVGTFDVLCVDSGMDGGGTCGWGHKWMVAKQGFVVSE